MQSLKKSIREHRCKYPLVECMEQYTLLGSQSNFRNRRLQINKLPFRPFLSCHVLNFAMLWAVSY